MGLKLGQKTPLAQTGTAEIFKPLACKADSLYNIFRRVPNYRTVYFSSHVLERIENCGRDYIDGEMVEEVLREPSQELPNKKPGYRKFWKRIGNYRYYVIVEELEHGDATVVTAFRE